MAVIVRVGNFIHRVFWLAPFVGGIGPSFRFWRKASKNFIHLGRGVFRNKPFVFRGLDVAAIKEIFVDDEYAFLLPHLANTPKPVVLDVGAHIGAFALWLLHHFPQAQIISVEADSDTANVLKQNADIMAEVGVKWQTVNKAAWHEDGVTVRLSNTGPSMGHRLSTDGERMVETTTLASLVQQVAGTIDALKIDIEGSEEAFLCATPELLRNVKCVIVELHAKLCNTECVKTVLSERYSHCENVAGRTSSKSLLLYY